MSADKTEVYVSTDIEADGPIPGPHSMLSLASAAFAGDGTRVADFSANLQRLPGAAAHPDTAAWWEQFPEAWQACRRDPAAPEAVMQAYCQWLDDLPGRPVFVGWPATWDFMWVYWYLMRFTGERPFGEGGIDIRSYAMGMRATAFLRSGKNYLPKRWLKADLPHTHVALDDALEQGHLFMNMLLENRRRR